MAWDARLILWSARILDGPRVWKLRGLPDSHWELQPVWSSNSPLILGLPCDRLHHQVHEYLNNRPSSGSEHPRRGSCHPNFRNGAGRIASCQSRLIHLGLTPATLSFGVCNTQTNCGWTGLSTLPQECHASILWLIALVIIYLKESGRTSSTTTRSPGVDSPDREPNKNTTTPTMTDKM